MPARPANLDYGRAGAYCALGRCEWGWFGRFFSRLLFLFYLHLSGRRFGERSGGAMVLGKLPVPRRPTIWITIGQGPTALVVDAGGGYLDIFSLLSPSLWETARYRLKYCFKGPLNPKQPTNQLWEKAQYRLKYCLKGP